MSVGQEKNFFNFMNKIKYSIVIPHYDIPQLLVRCVKSIPERDDIQVIVVDDNSPNAETYKEKYEVLNRKNVTMIITHEGRGAGYVRNVGLQYAVGEWVLFADADDFYVDNFIQLVDDNSQTDADIVYFNVKSVMSEDITKPAKRNESKNHLFERYEQTGEEISLRCGYCEPWGKMVRRQLIVDNNIKFDETRVSNDYYFSVVSGCLANKIKVVNKPLYVITQREGSLSAKFGDTMEKLLTRLDVASRVQLFCESHGYKLTPMPVRGLMVLLLKRSFPLFIKQLCHLQSKGISVLSFLWQMGNPKYMN